MTGSYVSRPDLGDSQAGDSQIKRGISMVEKVTDATFEMDVLKASGPVVVDFGRSGADRAA